MTTRRSRLSIKPNLGPKVGPGVKSGLSDTKPGGKCAVSKSKVPEVTEKTPIEESNAESPKKELRRILIERGASGDNESVKEIPAGDPETELEATSKLGNKTEKKSNDDSTIQQSLDSTPLSQNKNNSSSSKLSEVPLVLSESESSEPLSPVTESAAPKPVVRETELPALPSALDNNKQTNKGPTVIRSRFPKARPNIADAGRPKHSINVQAARSRQTDSCPSPIKSPRPNVCHSPVKTPTSQDSSSAAKSLQFKGSTESHTQAAPEAPKGEKRQPSNKPVETTGEKRHISHSEEPQVIKLMRHQSTGESQAEKRSTSISEVIPVKRRRQPKIDIPNDKPADKSKLKMRDLIYWNPVNNPMKYNNDKQKKTKPATDRISMMEDSAVSLITPTNEEIAADDPEPMNAEEAMPVPQVKIGPDGSIILNEESCVIKNKKTVIEEDLDTIDETDSNVTYTSFKQKRNRRSWSEKETAKFYKALRQMGTDFSLILKVFPDKTRDDIKKKFSLEDRKNRDKVEEALRNKMPFNSAGFSEEETEEVEPEQVKAKKPKKKKEVKPKKPRKKQSDWKHYYDKEETSDEKKEERRMRLKQQVELARKKIAEKNSQTVENESEAFIPPAARMPEDPKEVVEILMSMREDRNSTTGTTGNELSSLNPYTTHDQLGQILQQSGQTALLTDGQNGPFILVYTAPQDPSGETVIHVYKIQKDDLDGLTDGSSETVPSGASLLNNVYTQSSQTTNNSQMLTAQVTDNTVSNSSVGVENVFTPVNISTPAQIKQDMMTDELVQIDHEVTGQQLYSVASEGS